MTCILDQKLLPETAVAQLEALAQLLQKTLEKSLLGFILHGSAASSGFEIERSDLDLLAIVDGQLTPLQQETIGKGLLLVSNKPHPIEFSVIGKQELDNWSHPCTHQFHYGEDKRIQISEGSFSPGEPKDEDLAMHVAMARTRGTDLLGTYPLEKLPVIPRVDYLSAILSDFEWAESQEKDLGQYLVANACRTLAYLHSGVMLSKSEGIKWCLDKGIDTSNVVEEISYKLRFELGL